MFKRVVIKNILIRWFNKLRIKQSVKNLKLTFINSKFYDNGCLRNRLYVKNGFVLREVKFFYNGKLKEDKSYKKGVIHGISKIYDISGKLIFSRIFENGRLVSETNYKNL
jgi:antitoxin component YwqK of YwqJK toxin-antitoxin module